MSANDSVTLSFPDLSPAEASILAQELSTALAEAGVPPGDITRRRDKTDAQDMGAVLVLAGLAGPYLFELAKEAGKGFVKGTAHAAGSRVMDAILRKWGTRAEARKSDGETIVIGQQHARAIPARTLDEARTLAQLHTLGVVLLGASAFPNYPAERKLDNPAFKRSAELARQLLTPARTVFRETRVLDLFDQDVRPDEIVDRIESHVAGHPGMNDVVLYYCGHGDFLPDRERTYYLALRGTRPGREAATGLGLKAFRTMIEHQATLLGRRCAFILDCCFAGAAVEAFQASGLDPMIEAQVRDLPSRGFALLTAADRNLPAIGRDGQGATMFTGALAEVLDGAGAPGGRPLSLSDLCAETARRIKWKHGQAGVVPQCHAPGQSDGDVSRVPMFVIGAAAPLAASDAPVAAPRAASAPPASGGGFLNRLFAGGPAQAPSEVALAAAEWKRLQTSTDSSLLRSFARQFPGYYGEMATDRAAELEQAAAAAERARIESERQTRAEREARHDAAFAAAQQAASVEAFEIFLSDFPASPHATEVRDNLPALRAHEAQAAEAWADLRASTNSDRLEQFARHFPGKFATMARHRIESLKAASALRPGQIVRDIDGGPEMVLVPGGTFMMGEKGGQHKVTIAAPLLVGKYPVTFAEWDAAVAAGGVEHKPEDNGWGRGRRPVINVSWDDAQAYAKWLSEATGKSYRLLSEAEWEYCCRAGTTSEFSWGDEISPAQANYDGNYIYGAGKKGEYRKQTTPVDSFKPNAFGLHDMHGNVWEWCEDCWHGNYQGAPADGSAWLQGGEASMRVVRGGSWFYGPGVLRSACRDWYSSGRRSNVLGFRVVRPLVSPQDALTS